MLLYIKLLKTRIEREGKKGEAKRRGHQDDQEQLPKTKTSCLWIY